MITPLKILLTALWAFGIIIAYYRAPTHGYEFSGQFFSTLADRGLGIYLIIIGIAYGLWRLVTTGMKSIAIRPISLFGLFYTHLLLASLIYFSVLNNPAFTTGDGMVMWGRIVMLTLVPLGILLTAYVFGRAITRFVLPEEKNSDLTALLSIGVGFTALISAIFILSNFIGYTIGTLVCVFVAALALSYREFIPLWSFFTTPLPYARSDEEGFQMRRSIAELAYIVISFLLIVSVISCFRAAPIGWDDSGVYMNWPRTMALSGELLQWGMYAWQLVTGIGYLMGRAAQAFMINQLGSVLIILSSVAGYRLLLSGRTYSLPYGLIAAAIFLAMPMIVFQQAKDMKLDPALLGLSMTAMFALFEAVRRVAHGEWKDTLKLLALIGVIIGGVFAVKFTSLMFIMAALALLVFVRLWAVGLFGYSFLVSGIFTLWGLWKMMNVVVSKDPQSLLIAGAMMACIGVLALGWQRDSKKWKLLLKDALALLAGFVLALSPWLVKNSVDTISADQKLSVTTLLNGYIDDEHAFRPDYTKIYTPEQIKAGERSVVEGSVNEEGLAGNEDLGRYFGYEKGLNNYLKLPINLTLQSNQSGEYTEIGYWYLAFIPVIFAWFQWRRKHLALGGIALLTLLMALYYHPSTNGALSSLFSLPRFPLAYIFVLAPIVAGLVAILFGLQSDRRSDAIRFVAIMSAVYGTLFLVSAFGIVWYGILIYPLMLAAIFLALSDAEEDLSSESSPWLPVLMGIVVTIFALYFLRSGLPHGWNNLLSVTYPEYKAGKMNETISIFAYRSVDDIRNLASLNIDPTKGAAFLSKLTPDDLMATISYPGVQKALSDLGGASSLTALALQAPRLAEVVRKQEGDPAQKQVAISELTTIATEALRRLDTILVPGELKNEGKIYRIGTFLTYYISQNQRRYLEDSLIFTFDQWFYDRVPEVTIERMKTLGIRHLLIDLNAATIDRDPRRALTERFEKLLLTTRAKNLDLISTDSICLETALKMPTLTDAEFLTLAGVNYESFTTGEDGGERVTYRGEKLGACREKILALYNSGSITPETYLHLMPLKASLDQLVQQSAGAAPSPNQVGEVLQRFIPDRTWMVLFQIL